MEPDSTAHKSESQEQCLDRSQQPTRLAVALRKEYAASCKLNSAKEGNLMASNIRIGAISLDCPDPTSLANFYATLLGTEVAFQTENFAAIHAGETWLSMQKVEDHKFSTWPNSMVPQQIHLDFAVVDLDESESAAITAGATRASAQPSPDRWRVMIDPAGHPFCLTTLIPD
jgi:hypothetical protein